MDNKTEHGVYTIDNEVTEYHYTSYIGTAAQVNFVKAVTQMIIGGGEYIPLLKEPLFNYVLLSVFTDIDLTKYVDEDGDLLIDAFVEFDTISGVSAKLKLLIDSDVLYQIQTSLDTNLAYKTGLHKDDMTEAVVELVKTIGNKINSIGKDLNTEKVNEFITKFNNSDLNTESIVKAYLDSDGFNSKMNDTISAKNAVIDAQRDKIMALEAQIAAKPKSTKTKTTKTATKTTKTAAKTKTTRKKATAKTETENSTENTETEKNTETK